MHLVLTPLVEQTKSEITLKVSSESYVFTCPDETTANEWVVYVTELMPATR